MVYSAILKPCWRCHRHVAPGHLHDIRGARICADCGQREIEEYRALIAENLAALTRKAVGQ